MWARLTVVLEWYSGFILLFFFAINTYYLVLTVAGFWRTLRVFKEVQRPDQRRAPPLAAHPADLGPRSSLQRRGECSRQCALAAHARLPAL